MAAIARDKTSGARGIGQPEGVSDCVVRTTEASIGKQGPSTFHGKGTGERNAPRARKMENGARAIRQADENTTRREGEKGKGRRETLAGLDRSSAKAREGVEKSKSLRESRGRADVQLNCGLAWDCA